MNFGVEPAELASVEDINNISKGDLVTLVYWDDANEQNTRGIFEVLSVSNGEMHLSDPNHIINPGDSGSGAFLNGRLVGNIWSITNPLGEVNVSLLPLRLQK